MACISCEWENYRLAAAKTSQSSARGTKFHLQTEKEYEPHSSPAVGTKDSSVWTTLQESWHNLKFDLNWEKYSFQKKHHCQLSYAAAIPWSIQIPLAYNFPISEFKQSSLLIAIPFLFLVPKAGKQVSKTPLQEYRKGEGDFPVMRSQAAHSLSPRSKDKVVTEGPPGHLLSPVMSGVKFSRR